MADSFTTCFSKSQTEHTDNRFISWNFKKYSCIIINVDGNCNDTPIYIGFGGALHASNGTSQCGLFGFIPNSLNILHAELWIMYQGLSLAKGIDIIESTCYSNSSLSISLIENPLNEYYKHGMLIQSIKDIILDNVMFRVIHIFREGNQNVDFMAKLGTSNDIDLPIHPFPLKG